MRNQSGSSLSKLSNKASNRALVFACCSAIASILMFAAGQGSAEEKGFDRNKSAVDFPTFQTLADDAETHRKTRLISLEQFQEMGRAEDTIILDTRSKSAFEAGHIKGAVHLNFSDFTEDKLAQVVSGFDQRILIYCNNNFSDDVPPVPVKKVSLALNIPTFINLYGYGYTNIFELGEEVSIEELGDDWVVDSLSLAPIQTYEAEL